MHVKSIEQRCPDIHKNPWPVLKAYHVDLVLWNEQRHPEWKISHREWTVVQKGDGWSLYQATSGL